MTIHQKNIQALPILTYKVTNNIASTIVSELLSFSNINYNTRSGSQFHQPSTNTVWNGSETISYLGPKIWNMVPAEMKQESSLSSFKEEIKKWIPENCPCRICKKHLFIYLFIHLFLIYLSLTTLGSLGLIQVNSHKIY